MESTRPGDTAIGSVSVVAFIALRLRFVRSVAVTIGYVLMFVAFWLTFASGPLVLGLFFVAAAAGVASIGTYLLEDAERSLFAQRRAHRRAARPGRWPLPSIPFACDSGDAPRVA